jgi:ribosome biogenesis protein NSA2
VPIPKVRGILEKEVFMVVKTGKKTHKKGWKRMITKPTFVGLDFTRRPVMYERFIRLVCLIYAFDCAWLRWEKADDCGRCV